MTIRIRRWQAGDRLRAPRLNETVDTVNTLFELLPARLQDQLQAASDEAQVSQETDNAQTDAEQAADSEPLAEQWIFLTSTTSTERITDADDSNTFVDVTKTTSITFIKPDGTLITLPLEA